MRVEIEFFGVVWSWELRMLDPEAMAAEYLADVEHAIDTGEPMAVRLPIGFRIEPA
jgi:hypothetical protein